MERGLLAQRTDRSRGPSLLGIALKVSRVGLKPGVNRTVKRGFREGQAVAAQQKGSALPDGGAFVQADVLDRDT